jgi:hypothetical protein
VSEGAAANPIIRQQARDTVNERRRQWIADTLFVLSRPEGQRFLAGLIDETGFYRDVFKADARESARDEGRKSIGLFMRSVAIACGRNYWHSIEAEIIRRRTVPTNKPQEKSDE